jgi:diguanylate cyclase (GGDEF)-like protein
MINLAELKEYTKGMSVLYVGDDKYIQKDIYDFLKKYFLLLDVASNTKEGLDLYKKSKYSLIICDVFMPNIDGIKMSKKILNQNPNQSIIINSEQNSAEYLLGLINIGITHYLLKPIGMKQFMKVIYKVAKNHYNERIIKVSNDSLKEENMKLEKIIAQKSDLISKQAYKNNLTGLDNLLTLMNSLKEYDYKRPEFTVIMLLDIDNLQSINDLYGRNVGNQVLIHFSDFLKEYISQHVYKIYHISGDQFVLLDWAPYIDTEKYEHDFAQLQRMIKDFTFYVIEAEKELSINVTVGMSLGHENPLEHADMALKNAKENRKSYAVYNTLIDVTLEMQEKMEWSQRIRYAIENDNIVPVYHPIVNQKGKIVKYESLMRMLEIKDGKEILIFPDDFLNVAFDTKQYTLISTILINKVLENLKTSEHTVSINLSYSDINDKTFMESLYKKIKNYEIADRLVVEITENENMRDYTLLKKSIQRFHHLGVKIAIDDFGSGYSNFSQILKIHPEYIKIDGSLIENIDVDTHAFLLTKAICTFFGELGIKVIAEYVHSKEVYDILKQFKIDEFQGYYFFEPVRYI